jgi:hypothetical protein
MTTTTPRLGITELEADQAVPETTVNEAQRFLEQGANFFIAKDKDTLSPPGSPADGDCYVIAGTGTGGWSGKDQKIAFRMSTGWLYITPIEGTTAYLQDEDAEYRYSGAAWALASGSGGALIADTDGTLAANSDARVATQKAVKTYVDASVTGLLDYKGTTDCSANPNYPAASKGDTYIVSVAGKIGGASGTVVDAGDWFIAKADNAGGTEASVGSSWGHVEHNVVISDVAYDATSWDGNLDAPTKNAVRDKIEAIVAGIPGTYTDEMARDAIGAALVAGNGISIAVDDPGDTITIKAKGLNVSSQAGTSYTAVLGDADSYIQFTSGSAVAFTIPANASVAFPVGTVLVIEQNGAGAVTFTPDTGVTLHSRGGALATAGQYAVAQAKKVATNIWTIIGDVA